MALITSISNFLANLRSYTLTQITNIVDARFRGDTEATKANKEYVYNNIAGYLKALGIAVAWKNTLYVKSDAPDDFDGSDSTIFQTAQEAVDAIPTTGLDMPTAINPYVIIGDPLIDFSAVDWSAHITAGTYPFILTTTIGGNGSIDTNTTVKSPVRVATTTVLPACTYNNTTGKLTANANGALAQQDQVTLIAGDDILVKNQASALQNGIYTVTQIGSGGTPFILTRRSDANSSAKMISGILIPVSEGVVYKDRVYILTTNNPITLGTTSLAFSPTNKFPLEYVVALDQSGTNDIAATIINNTTGQTIDFTGSYQGVGTYEINFALSDPLTSSILATIEILENFILSGTKKARAFIADDTTITINTYNGGVPANDVLSQTRFLVKLYY